MLMLLIKLAQRKLICLIVSLPAALRNFAECCSSSGQHVRKVKSCRCRYAASCGTALIECLVRARRWLLVGCALHFTIFWTFLMFQGQEWLSLVLFLSGSSEVPGSYPGCRIFFWSHVLDQVFKCQ